MFRHAKVAAFCGLSSHLALRFSFCDSEENIVLKLTPASKAQLDKRLGKLRLLKNFSGQDFVVLRRSVDSEARDYYYGFVGQKLSFRLKGYMLCKDGKNLSAAGFGVVRNMNGIVKDERYENSVSFIPNNQTVNNDIVMETADIPTRAWRDSWSPKTKDDSLYWKQYLRSLTVQGKSHPAVKCEGFRFEMKDQVVLEGILHSTKYLDDEVQSKLDEKVVMTTSTSEAAPQKQNSGAGTSSNSSSDGEQNKGKCPLCVFMEGGACKEQYMHWDTCLKGLQPEDELQKCYSVTTELFTCMKKHEYYDPVTAGMETMVEAADAENTSSTKGGVVAK